MGISSRVSSAWTANWVLTDQGIACAKCHRLQPITDAESAFVHEAGCEANFPQRQAQGTPLEHGVETDELVVAQSQTGMG